MPVLQEEIYSGEIVMKKQVEAFKQGYSQCMQDMQSDILDNWIELKNVVWSTVDMKKRVTEFAKELKAKEEDL